MPRRPILTLNGILYNRETLSDLREPINGTPFEIETLRFCRDWLNGRETYFLTTSGSTGPPKSITLGRSQLEASARLTQEALHLKAGETALIALDTAYIAGKMMLVRSFITGMNMVAVTPTTNPLKTVPAGIQIDFASFVPYQLKAILSSSDASRLNNIRNILVGGAPTGREVFASLQNFSCAAYTTFGMTETISHIALQRINGETASFFYTTLPGVIISTDQRGCLVVETPFLLEKVITNDIVDISSPTSFRWMGRWDNIINTGGVKVNPEVVEMACQPLFKDRRYFVGGIPDAQLGERVILAVEGEPFKKSEETTLLGKLGKNLTRFETPKAVHYIERFPVTATGKLDRPRSLAIIQEANH